MPSLNHSGRRRANGCPDQVNTQADNRADNEADNESSIESCVSQDKFETSNVSLPSQQQMSFSCEHSNSCFQQTNGKRFVHQHHFHIPRKGTLPSPLQSTSSSRPISSNKVFCSQKIIKICHIWIPVTAFELPAAPIKSIHESIMKPIQSEYPKRLIRNNQVHPFCFRLSFKLDASLECRQTASQSRHSTQLTCCCILHLPNISIANLLFLGTIHSIARRSARRHDLPNSELFSQARVQPKNSLHSTYPTLESKHYNTRARELEETFAAKIQLVRSPLLFSVGKRCRSIFTLLLVLVLGVGDWGRTLERKPVPSHASAPVN